MTALRSMLGSRDWSVKKDKTFYTTAHFTEMCLSLIGLLFEEEYMPVTEACRMLLTNGRPTPEKPLWWSGILRLRHPCPPPFHILIPLILRMVSPCLILHLYKVNWYSDESWAVREIYLYWHQLFPTRARQEVSRLCPGFSWKHMRLNPSALWHC